MIKRDQMREWCHPRRTGGRCPPLNDRTQAKVEILNFKSQTTMMLKICTLLVFFSSLFMIAPGSAVAQRRQQVKVYLVALDDNGKLGKKIGCDDSLVPVTRSIRTTAAPLKAALEALLSTPPETGENPKLQNFWKGRNLKVRSVSIRKATATIRISGEVFVAGICDQPRIESQIEETTLQFPTVKRVRVFIGKRTMADAIR